MKTPAEKNQNISSILQIMLKLDFNTLLVKKNANLPWAIIYYASHLDIPIASNPIKE